METHSDKRVQLLRETLVNTKGGDLVWIAAAPELNETTILTGTVWTDMQGQQRSIAQDVEWEARSGRQALLRVR